MTARPFCPTAGGEGGVCTRPTCPYCGPDRMRVLHPLLLKVIGSMAADVWDEKTLVEHVHLAAPWYHELVRGALMRLVAEQFDFSSVNGDGSYTPATFLEHLHTVMGYSHYVLIEHLRDLAAEADPESEGKTFALARRRPADRSLRN